LLIANAMTKRRTRLEKRSVKLKANFEPGETRLKESSTTDPRDKVGTHSWNDTRSCGRRSTLALLNQLEERSVV